MAKLFTTIEEISQAEAYEGTGNWGVKLMDNDVVAYECPMLGDGGGSKDYGLIGNLLASYTNPDNLDAEDGPDEILYKIGDSYFLVSITVE